VTPPSTIYRPPLLRNIERNAESSSIFIDVPNEANKIGLWMTLTQEIPDPAFFSSFGVHVIPMWSDGITGKDITPTLSIGRQASHVPPELLLHSLLRRKEQVT